MNRVVVVAEGRKRESGAVDNNISGFAEEPTEFPAGLLRGSLGRGSLFPAALAESARGIYPGTSQQVPSQQ